MFASLVKMMRGKTYKVFVSDYSSSSNLFSTLVWETLVKREEDYERGWEMNVYSWKKLAAHLYTQTNIYAHTHTHTHTNTQANGWPFVFPRHVLLQSPVGWVEKPQWCKLEHKRNTNKHDWPRTEIDEDIRVALVKSSRQYF